MIESLLGYIVITNWRIIYTIPETDSCFCFNTFTQKNISILPMERTKKALSMYKDSTTLIILITNGIFSAEGEGFKPPIPERGIPDFESSAFGHSANLPCDCKSNKKRRFYKIKSLNYLRINSFKG